DRPHESAHRLEQRGLAAAGRPEDDEAVRLVDCEIDLVGRGHEMPRRLVLQRDTLDLEQAHLVRLLVSCPEACALPRRTCPATKKASPGSCRRGSYNPRKPWSSSGPKSIRSREAGSSSRSARPGAWSSRPGPTAPPPPPDRPRSASWRHQAPPRRLRSLSGSGRGTWSSSTPR